MNTETHTTKLKDLDHLRCHTIILDDMVNNKLDVEVSTIISKGRHHNIQLILLAHSVVDLKPKSRYDVREIYVTYNNRHEFFKNLKTKF